MSKGGFSTYFIVGTTVLSYERSSSLLKQYLILVRNYGPNRQIMQRKHEGFFI